MCLVLGPEKSPTGEPPNIVHPMPITVILNLNPALRALCGIDFAGWGRVGEYCYRAYASDDISWHDTS